MEKAKKNNKTENESISVEKQSSETSAFQLVDKRPVATAQMRLQDVANNSIQMKKAAQFHKIANGNASQVESIQKKENKTGLPANLKSGIEHLSGLDISDVKVHYNSSKPAQLQAHAFAQGNNIHMGPGQEKHLPHEAWHVVQQKQGRVKPTVQMKGADVNDDPSLEHEADIMGTKALQMKSKPGPQRTPKPHRQSIIQLMLSKADYFERALNLFLSVHTSYEEQRGALDKEFKAGKFDKAIAAKDALGAIEHFLKLGTHKEIGGTETESKEESPSDHKESMTEKLPKVIQEKGTNQCWYLSIFEGLRQSGLADHILTKNPKIHTSPYFKPGESRAVWQKQFERVMESIGVDSGMPRPRGTSWQSLINKFFEKVLHGYSYKATQKNLSGLNAARYAAIPSSSRLTNGVYVSSDRSVVRFYTVDKPNHAMYYLEKKIDKEKKQGEKRRVIVYNQQRGAKQSYSVKKINFLILHEFTKK